MCRFIIKSSLFYHNISAARSSNGLITDSDEEVSPTNVQISLLRVAQTKSKGPRVTASARTRTVVSVPRTTPFSNVISAKDNAPKKQLKIESPSLDASCGFFEDSEDENKVSHILVHEVALF